MFKRITNSVRLGIWAFKNPAPLSLFTSLSDLFMLILKVANEDRPYMTDIVVSINGEVKQPIVHIWAGNGAGADPFKRLQALAEEAEELREHIRRGK